MEARLLEAHLLSSKISAVTVYRSGARVTRSVDITGKTGSAGGLLRVDGLPLSMDDSSVATRVTESKNNSLIVTDYRIVLDIPDDTKSSSAPSTELHALRRKVRQLAARLKYLQAELEVSIQVPSRPTPEPGQPPLASPLEARLALMGFANSQRDSLSGELFSTQEKLEETQEELSLLEARERESSSAGSNEEEVRKSLLLTTHGQASESSILNVEYFVPGACWVPSYSVRFSPDLSGADLAMRAMVVQRSGENWSDTALTLSTAASQEWHELPELQSKRIGRRQNPKPARAWKAPPTGAEELYRDYDSTFGRALPGGAGQSAEPELFASIGASAPEPVPMPIMAMDKAELEESYDDFDDEDTAAGEYGANALSRMVASPAMAPPAAAYAAPMKSGARKSMKKKSAPMRQEELTKEISFGGGGGFPDEDAPAILAATVGIDVELLAYARLRMASADSFGRGALELKSLSAVYSESVEGTTFSKSDIASRLAQEVYKTRDIAEVPTGHTLPWSTDYDYAFTSQSRVDLASDGQFHSIPVVSNSTKSNPRHVVVPRESTDVFRTVEVQNPFAGPLLAGPIDVYWDDAFLLTSHVDFTAPRGKVSLGLGVDQDVRVARNTHFREDTVGLMGGGLALNHKIVIDVANNTGHSIELEVRERVPNAAGDEDDIKVELKSVQPPWLDWEPLGEDAGDEVLRGGHRWELRVEAGQKQSLSASYEIKLPSKYEIRGGNRREW